MQRATVSVTPFAYVVSISIHALYAEGDLDKVCAEIGEGISIHALYAEGDLSLLVL